MKRMLIDGGGCRSGIGVEDIEEDESEEGVRADPESEGGGGLCEAMLLGVV